MGINIHCGVDSKMNYDMIELIKEQLPIEEAIERYTSIDLSRAKNGRGSINVRCPFHSDRSPSFTIWTDTNRWKCQAGCGKGDVIDLVAISQQISIKDAINLLKNDLSLLEEEDPVKSEEFQKKVDKKKADQKLIQEFKNSFNDTFHRLLKLERMIEDKLSSAHSLAVLNEIGELYHVLPYIGYLLDCMVYEPPEDQIYAYQEARKVLNKWDL